MENWHWTVLQPLNILVTMASEHIWGLKFKQKLSVGNQQIKKTKKKGKKNISEKMNESVAIKLFSSLNTWCSATWNILPLIWLFFSFFNFFFGGGGLGCKRRLPNSLWQPFQNWRLLKGSSLKNCAWSLAEVMGLICKKSLYKGTGQWNQWELFNFMSLTFVWHCNYSMTLLTTSSWHEALANFNKLQFPLGLGQFSSHLPGLKTQSQTWSTKKLWKLQLIFPALGSNSPLNFTHEFYRCDDIHENGKPLLILKTEKE